MFVFVKILEEDEIIGCVTMEPYLQGDFVKLTNNTGKVVKRLEATEYGIAFGHFTYLYSNNQEIVVDLQGVYVCVCVFMASWHYL